MNQGSILFKINYPQIATTFMNLLTENFNQRLAFRDVTAFVAKTFILIFVVYSKRISSGVFIITKLPARLFFFLRNYFYVLEVGG